MSEDTRTHQPGDQNPTRTGTPAADPNATLLKPQGQTAALAPDTGLSVPGFEIECEIGSGGMGVVYRAKQIGLNRTVALKMLLAGPFASASLRARFLLEAESVAALEHPHIVRVHAFGEHGHHPYLAMEFLPGGTLADRIKKNGPLSAEDATELVAKLAGAVAHAHSRGVVHRDIKPLNVMFASDGEPRVTDFGLAKVGRADQNLSMTGQVLGTPSYMAPEQAAGKVHEVGTAADVYALGAVLYDALTGRPPFQGDSAAVTLQKVMTEEPQRPRKLNASIPADLETICLKCLEKDPAKRYPTAQALADDLLRYARNEPISVRPAGTLERGLKWVKRNKVIAGAIAAVSLALLVGAGVSLGFGLYANEKAEEAKRKQKDAEDAAEREKAAAERARNESTRADRERDAANRALSKALLASIPADRYDPRLTKYEVKSFWQLTSLRRDEVAWLFLDEATRTLPECEQLYCRAEFALNAAIGLDPERRSGANSLLLTRMKDPQTTAEQRMTLALACACWGDAIGETNSEAAEVLANGIVDPEDGVFDRLELARAFRRVVSRLPSEQAVQRLIDVLARTTNFPVKGRGPESPAWEELQKALAAVAHRLPPERAAQQLTTAMKGQIKTDFAIAAFAVAFGYVAQNLPPERARQECTAVAEDLIAKMEKARSVPQLLALMKGLFGVSHRLPVKPVVLKHLPDARKAIEAALKAIKDKGVGEDDAIHALWLECDAAATQRVPAEDIELYVQRLAVRLGFTGQPVQLSERLFRLEAELWASLIERLDRARATEMCDRYAEGIIKCFAQERRHDQKAALMVVARHATAGKLSGLLTKAMHERSWFLEDYADALSVVGQRFTSEQADEVAELLRKLIVEGEKYNERSLARALAAVVQRQAPKTAAEPLFETFQKFRELGPVGGRSELAKPLAVAAQCLSPEKRAVLCDQLVARLDSDYRFASRKLAEALVVLAQLHPERKADLTGRTTEQLIKWLRESRDGSDVELLTSAFAVVAPHLNAEQARKFTRQFAHDMNQPADTMKVENLPLYLDGLASAFVEFVHQLPAEEAVVMRFLFAQQLTDKLTHNSEKYPAGSPSSGFAAIIFGLPIAKRNYCRDLAVFASGGFATPHNILPSLPLLHPRFHPQPKPLPPQELVELLKHPFCVGEARRAVLDALEFTYKRTFRDQWEFVEFVQQNNVHDHTTGKPLDLLTPPKRPELKP